MEILSQEASAFANSKGGLILINIRTFGVCLSVENSGKWEYYILFCKHKKILLKFSINTTVVELVISMPLKRTS